MEKEWIYQTSQIRMMEQLASERFGISSSLMMQRAGQAVFEFLRKRFPQYQHIAVCCGGGNNGGDGYVFARIAHQHGLQINIWQVDPKAKLKKDAEEALQACQALNIPIAPFEEHADLSQANVIIDAICGIGLQTDLREHYANAIKCIQNTNLPIIAIDIPSGISADTGQILGVAIRATATVTMMGLKLGLLTGAGIAHTGECVVDDLQLPQALFSEIKPVAEKIAMDTLKKYLEPRPKDWHKGLSGHVLIIGGYSGYSGAPRMAGEAALRVGAGLVTVATHPSHAMLINATCPEIMCHGVSNEKELLPLLNQVDVIVIGPGLSLSPWAKSLWMEVVKQKKPLLVDADGLNLLAETQEFNDNFILTPHPGEAARLLHQPVQDVQNNRFDAIQTITKRYGGICVLKGAGSLVYAKESRLSVCTKGNPGMATAGMGDVLSGVIGGFIAQGIHHHDAAKLGVYLHALAGDAAAACDGERGMIATDLIPYLRHLANNESLH